MVKLGLSNCVLVTNSLLIFYGKCGDAETSEIIFDKLLLRDISSWNTMISLNAQMGRLYIAVKLFDRQNKMPEKRNIISRKCSHSRVQSKWVRFKGLKFLHYDANRVRPRTQ